MRAYRALEMAPDLLPDEALAQKHVLERGQPLRELLDGPGAHPGLGFCVIIDTVVLWMLVSLWKSTRRGGKSNVFYDSCRSESMGALVNIWPSCGDRLDTWR